MLQNLYIKNFLIIDQLEIEFSNGFNVITGSTGAGKSILLKALLFCLGRKNIPNPIKTGEEQCLIICNFQSNNIIEHFLKEQELPSEPELIIRCSQKQKNRKKFFVNDQPVTNKIILALFNQLIEIHGQHNHTLLLDKNAHLAILDQYACLNAEKNELKTIYQAWQHALQKLAEFEQNKNSIEEERIYLQQICQEIEQANIQVNEEEELVCTKKLLQNRDQNLALLKNIITEIDQSNFAQILAKAERHLTRLDLTQISQDQKLLSDFANIEDNFGLIYDKIEGTKQLLEKFITLLHQNETSLEIIDDRLHEIRTLARKYRIAVSQLPNFAQKAANKEQELAKKLDDNSELLAKANNFAISYQKLAATISAKRKEAALELEQKVGRELASLDMQKAVFTIKLETSNKPKEYGIDQVQFLASTNPGSDLAAIDQIASGGELSRFMLSLRVALFYNAEKYTIIFDEIDVGISGHVADSMGARIKLLSKIAQIIVITHQPQVAGKADQHILIEKLQGEHATHINSKLLNQQERAEEIARMISGQNVTATSIKAAQELITD